MSEIKDLPLELEQRKQIIKDNIARLTQGQIAEMCGVDRKTIYRDIQAMKESGEWYEWIEAEMLRLHRSGNIDDQTKYKELAKLYARTITQKSEVSIQGFELRLRWTPDDEDQDEEPETEA